MTIKDGLIRHSLLKAFSLIYGTLIIQLEEKQRIQIERGRSIKIIQVKVKKKYLGRRLPKETFEIKAHSFFISGIGNQSHEGVQADNVSSFKATVISQQVRQDNRDAG